MTQRRTISSGSSFEEQIGYSRAVVSGDWVHVSGTTGFDYATMTIPDGVVEQAEQCERPATDHRVRAAAAAVTGPTPRPAGRARPAPSR